MENLAYNTPIKEVKEATQQFLTFKVEGNEYAVDIMKVMEIKGWTETTRIPNSPTYMRGVINLRGLVIPIFDLRSRFNQGETNATEKNVVIVISIGKRTIGILVDAVSDILTVKQSEIKLNPTANDAGIDDAYVSGLISNSDNMVIILDTDYLFDGKTLQKAEAVSSNA
ncbi:MAG: chemotaxis protein CheW [Rickettsiales bacterium]|nr:chemotaxis protein CheW [Rickettsiales bacterium]